MQSLPLHLRSRPCPQRAWRLAAQACGRHTPHTFLTASSPVLPANPSLLFACPPSDVLLQACLVTLLMDREETATDGWLAAGVCHWVKQSARLQGTVPELSSQHKTGWQRAWHGRVQHQAGKKQVQCRAWLGAGTGTREGVSKGCACMVAWWQGEKTQGSPAGSNVAAPTPLGWA